ncbi:HD domain-containing phosphohydrolase [Desulfobacula sp.]|uniref:response regulator n=1 Tax=Desulfobacula sp. TaxID=2593537 RepID=UPI002620F271|nr:HD domain-containing phosphohydrolase [Desulfobacula sp.]
MPNLTECKVLVVDDTESNIDILVDALGSDYEVSVAMDGESALQDIAEEIPDLILLDILMPGMSGYEVCKRVKADKKTQKIPIIFITVMTEEQDEAKGLALGAVDYITKPFSPELVKSRVKNQLELKRHRDNLEELVEERTRELAITQEVTIDGLAVLAEFRDPETGGHIQRTKNYMRILAERLKGHPKYCDFLDDTTIDLIYKSTPLHDIGKVGVPDNILLKPGRLTEEEFKEMERHVVYGHDALQKAERKLGENTFLRFAKEIATSHHEKWDGSGYPYGLKEEAIPLAGRLMAMADVYDALISKRVYKPPFSHEKVVDIIVNGDGRTEPYHFDPDVLKAFKDAAEDFRQVAIEFADYDEE